MPTQAHESTIQRYVADGYAKYGFSGFLKTMILNDWTRQTNLDGFYESLVRSDSQNAINCKIQKEINRQLSAVKSSDHLKCVDESGIGDSLAELAKFSYCDFSNLMQYRRVIPDCWRYNGAAVEVVEVKDHCQLCFDRLSRYADIDDELFNKGLPRINLREHYADTGYIHKHDLNLVCDLAEDPVYNDNENYKRYSEGLRFLTGQTS